MICFRASAAFSLGLERTGGFETVAFCEIEPYPRAVLAKHWPGVPCYDDVRTLTAARLAADGIAIDAICGGFPCQDLSVSGNGAGLSGERSGLWREYARLIGELRPQVVTVENVTALLWRGLGDVLGDLAKIGYDAEWHCISASAVGAPHERDRLWIMAYPNEIRRAGAPKQLARYEQVLRERISAAAFISIRKKIWDESVLSSLGLADGVSSDLDAIGGYGNAVLPQIPELIGRAILKAEGLSP